MADLSYSFGPFALDVQRLELWKDGTRLEVGARSCHVLLALLERQGKVVSQSELMDAAWPDLHVEDVNLRVHIAAIRKILSEGSEGTQYIKTIARQGYLFTAPVHQTRVAISGEVASRRAPRRVGRLVGRTDALQRLNDVLSAHRIVTVVGAGGIGKTSLALAMAAERGGCFGEECVYVDLATASASSHVGDNIFAAFNFEGSPQDITAYLVRALQDRSVLLVLDNCEHVVEEAATVAAALVRGTDRVTVLATSREPLEVTGEHVFPLGPLACAPEGAELTASSALNYAAVKMFAEIANARPSGFSIDDTNASAVGDICRKLDGIPLAIELAAAASDVFTVHELSRRLDDRFALLTRGARTALPRHRTLQAALDWGYGLLSETEAIVMRRLSVFRAHFTMADAECVVTDAETSADAVRNALAELVMKSWLTVDVSEDIASFRFLETMRLYAGLKLERADEVDVLSKRLAEHTLVRLVRASALAGGDDRRACYRRILDDWRVSHDWAERIGDWRMGLSLLALAGDLCFSLNVRGDYAERAVATLSRLPEALEESEMRAEMDVRRSYAQVLAETQPLTPMPFYDALALTGTRSFELATALNSPEHRLHALWSLILGCYNGSDSAAMSRHSATFQDVARASGAPDFALTAHRMNGLATYYAGDFRGSVLATEAALASARLSQTSIPESSLEHVASSRMLRARALWATGEFAAGLEEAAEAERLALRGGQAATIVYVITAGTLCINLWAGAIDQATASLKLFEDLAIEYSNPGWAAYVPGFTAALERCRAKEGSFGAGAIDWTPTCPYHADGMTSLHCSFHRPEDLLRIEAAPAHWCAAEHFRSAGEHILVAGGAVMKAQSHFERALRVAEEQGAAAWEIRARVSLARLHHAIGEQTATQDVLGPVLDRFPGVRVNTDLNHARALVDG